MAGKKSGGLAGAKESLRTRARLRERLLLTSFYRIRDDWTEKERSHCEINGQLVRMVSESYFKDLDRKKAFHDITYADEHKRFGYMLKWIMRFRPIQLTTENAGIKAILANEHFALTVGLRFLGIFPSALPPELYKCLIYSLRYRQIDANSWALSAYLLQEAYGTKNDPA